MSTFSVWLQAYTKDPKPKRVTWVCGDARVLVDDVVASTVKALDLRPWSETRFVMGEDRESAIWEALGQFPLELEDRVVVVYGAERIKNFSPLAKFIGQRKRNPHTYLILVSDSPRAERTKPNREEGTKAELLPHLALIQAKGRIVECKKFTNATAKHAVTWIQARAKVSASVATHILLRTNGDLQAIRDVCVKVSVLPEATNVAVNALTPVLPTDTFADALMVLDRKTALAALQGLSESERVEALYDLSNRLDTARWVNGMMTSRQSKTAIRAMLKERGQAHLVDYLMDTAKYYNPKRGLEVRRVLDGAIRAFESGARDGVLESVIAVW
jgi:DNA polymerase III delta subunit